MKQTYVYIVYAKRPPVQYTGILGAIDLYTVHLLLVGGSVLLEESYEGNDPVTWYKGILKDQGIFVIQEKQQNWKGRPIIWLEVDTDKTNLSEFTAWNELQKDDTDTLAWKPFYYPCHATTTKECLGFAVSSRETALQTSPKPITVQIVLDAIISSEGP